MATVNINTFGLFDTLESALMKIEYADSITVMLLNQSNLKKHDEIILSALLDLINEVRGNLMKVFYERDCCGLADGEYRNYFLLKTNLPSKEPTASSGKTLCFADYK